MVNELELEMLEVALCVGWEWEVAFLDTVSTGNPTVNGLA
jgi:hypothetical protein